MSTSHLACSHNGESLLSYIHSAHAYSHGARLWVMAYLAAIKLCMSNSGAVYQHLVHVHCSYSDVKSGVSLIADRVMCGTISGAWKFLAVHKTHSTLALRHWHWHHFTTHRSQLQGDTYSNQYARWHSNTFEYNTRPQEVIKRLA